VDRTTKLFRSEINFIAGAAKVSQIPNLIRPEIAFIGKSNVGKSSLINCLCNRHGLARVSHTPGRTSQINFFAVGEVFTLVDLPGYGFANVPLRVKEQWNHLVSTYLTTRVNLKLINLLIDARRGIKPHDEEIAKLLISHKKKFQIIFTKADKVSSRAESTLSGQNFLESLGYLCNVIYTSSRSKEGAKELQYSMAESIK